MQDESVTWDEAQGGGDGGALCGYVQSTSCGQHLSIKGPKISLCVLLVFEGAAAEPRLSVVSGEGETVVLQCESDCWFPEPSITFLDDQGKDLPALHPMRVQDSQGCFIVKRNVTLQTGTKRSEVTGPVVLILFL